MDAIFDLIRKGFTDLQTWLSARLENLTLRVDTVQHDNTQTNVKVTNLDTRLTAAVNKVAADLAAHIAGTVPDPGGGTDPDPDPDPGGGTPPVIDTSKGIIESVDYLRSRPKSGEDYSLIVSEVAKPFETPDLSDLDAQGDTKAVRAANLYAATGDESLFTRLWAHLLKILTTDWYRTLEAARGIPGYVHAMDVLKQIKPDLDVQWFCDFLVMALTRTLTNGHSGLNTILDSAFNQLNNWSGAARSAVITSALFLIKYGTSTQAAQAKIWLDKAVKVHRVFLGDLDESALGYKLDIDQTTWYGQQWPPAKVLGVLPRGTVIKGTYLGTTENFDLYGSGITPLEFLRTQGTSASSRIGKPAQYPLPNLDQGYIWEIWNVTMPGAVALHRAGLVDFDAGDFAIHRAFEWLYGRGEAAKNKGKDGKTATYPASGDDIWLLYYKDRYSKAGPAFAAGQKEGTPGKAGIGDGRWLYKL
jgi:hypothetical protein